ncbi:xanthotoxin 5-hydroxylase CYP82C4-like [Punica granatum]|uniref:Xanthotoxin 5-hydroxylase CYP82C4-like n=1 Tax=Punica granatum TaxID=22663 RepID=A0A6P8DFR9_PUNGR|nr:xanthotoxin 5-hydroxylase CYP82C4-like [Punica granatum]
MTWALSLLLNNKEASRRSSKNSDTQIGKDRQVNQSDLNNLPYLHTVIKETLRLYPAAPLSLPHEAMEDCNVSRFLTTHKDIDVRGQNFELIPIGSGRRMCARSSLAFQVVGLALTSFLHAFDVQTSGDGVVDMEEAVGLINLKATPLEVLPTPRVPGHVYNECGITNHRVTCLPKTFGQTNHSIS